MIRTPDLLRMSVRKAFSRKKWALATIVSLSLGVTVFTAATSLVDGVRELFMRSVLMELLEFPPEVVEIRLRDPKEPLPEGAKERFITPGDVANMGKIPGVRSVCDETKVAPVQARPLQIDTFEGFLSLSGLEEPFLERYLPPGSRLWQAQDRIPLILGRFHVKSRYDPVDQRFFLRPEVDENALIGTDVDLVIGSNFVYPGRYLHAWKDGREAVTPRKESEIQEIRRVRARTLARQYEPNLYNRTLRLKARVVGISPASRNFIPYSVARDCQKWIELRNDLARYRFQSGSRRIGGVSNPEGSYEVLMLVEKGADMPGIKRQVKQAGFYALSRDDLVREQMEPLESSMQIIRWIVLALGLIAFITATLFIFLTTSKVIADSQAEIGLLRALGTTRDEVLRIYLAKASILGMLGALLGLLMGYGLAAALTRVAMGYARKSHLVWRTGVYGLSLSDVFPESLWRADPWMALTILASGLLASLVAGMWPARKAARLDPVEALRREP